MTRMAGRPPPCDPRFHVERTGRGRCAHPLGVHVNRLHEPTRLVGADWNHRDVEWAVPFTNARESRVIGRIADEKDPPRRWRHG